MKTDDHDPRWEALERAKPEIVQRLAGHGVMRVEYVAGFPELDNVGVCVVVRSDRERDAVAAPFELAAHEGRSGPRRLSNELADEVAAILRAEADGLELGNITVVVQSQEAVDRDFDGSWFYAMR